MSGFHVQSAGYGGLENTPLNRPEFSDKIMAVDYEDNWTHNITNTTLIGEIKPETLEIQYIKPPEVGGWRPASINQEMIPQSVSLVADSLSIHHLAYLDLKFDELTIGFAASRWADFEKAFLNAAWRRYADSQREWILNQMVLECDPKYRGLNAGLYGNKDLGDFGNPKAITPATLVKELVYLRQILRENLAWVENEMFLILPTEFFPVLVQSDLANSAFTGPARPKGTVVVDGMWPQQLMGFDVIETIHAPTYTEADGRTCFHIIAGHKDAFAYAGAIIHSRVARHPRYLGVEYQAWARWGGKMIYPKKLALAYWHFAI